MSFAYHSTKTTLTKQQKNNLTKRRKYGTSKKPKDRILSQKNKFFCPTYNSGYYGSANHSHCKLCYNRLTYQDKHDVIPFDDKIHQW